MYNHLIKNNKKYKNMTPWPELDPAEHSMKLKIIRKILHILPQKFVLLIVSFLYNSVRPKIKWKNE